MNRGPRAPGGPECRATKNIMQWPNLLMTTIWYFTSLATWKSNFTKDRLHKNVCKKCFQIGWKCTRKRLAAGLRPDLLGELKRSPRPRSCNGGPTSKGRWGERGWEGPKLLLNQGPSEPCYATVSQSINQTIYKFIKPWLYLDWSAITPKMLFCTTRVIANGNRTFTVLPDSSRYYWACVIHKNDSDI